MTANASSRPVRWPLVLVSVLLLVPTPGSWSLGRAADTAPLKPGSKARWTTSKLVGSPDPPPPYRVEPAFPRLKFDSPVVVTAARGIDRLFVAELGGKVYSFPNRPDVARADLALDLTQTNPLIGQVFGMAFPPNFERTKRIFLCYTLKGNQPDGTRVSSFSVVGTDPPRIAPETEKPLLTWQAGGHNAGCLAFDPAGMLYIGAGDTADPTPPDPLRTGQRIDDIPSSLLRIDVDHTDPGKNYAIPADNPFVTVARARPEVWAFGLRNPWRFSADRQTGDIWVGDVGWELWEMIHLARSGGNYGWSITEGPQPVYPDAPRGPGPIVPPVVSHPHSEAGSITGGYVYRGRKLPGLVGVYIYGDFQSGKVWGLRHDGSQLTWRGELANTPLQLVSFGEDNEGEVYAIDFQRTHQIYQFVPDTARDTAAAFPRTLGQTGLFSDVKTLAPAPGVYPYSINAALWSDHAEADRLLAIPGSGRVVAAATGPWGAPDGTVLARTITMDMERDNPKSRRRLETQILHQEAGTWRPYTYVWNEAQTDADLADPQGMTRTLTIQDAHAPGGTRVQTYRTFARSECVVCHNPWVERQTTIFGRQTASPLAFHTAQLNRTIGVGKSARSQLQALRDLDLIDGPTPSGSDPLPRLADPYDRRADLTARARAYLGVNCAHCHLFGAGGSANIFLDASFPIERTKTIDAVPMQGTFGIADARIITPGDPSRSILYYRMAKLGGGRMPRSGSGVVDEAAVRLIHDWIKAMPGASGSPTPADLPPARAALTHLEAGLKSSPESRVDAAHRLLATPREALGLMRSIDLGRLDKGVTREVLAEVRDSPSIEVKDLFERFIPAADRARRLGDTVRPADILSLTGDPRRGASLFLAGSTLCATCHRVGGKGGVGGVGLGPDLDAIGAKYDRATLLRQILEPSLVIDPKYVPQALETRAGLMHSGLLVERSALEVVLTDSKHETIRVPLAEVESLTPQAKSLMPDALLRDLTAQEAADLLDYLGSLKAAGP